MILENLRKFAQLPGKDKKVVAVAICGTIATRIMLRVSGYREWKEFLQSPQPLPAARERHTSDLQIVNRARRIAQLQLAGERSLFLRPSCLEHSLVLRRLLLREAIPARLRFGGRKEGGQFTAHAWVEVFDTKFDNSNEPVTYAPFTSIHSMTEE